MSNRVQSYGSAFSKAIVQTTLPGLYTVKRSLNANDYAGAGGGAGGFYPQPMVNAANALNNRLNQAINNFRSTSPELDLGPELGVMRDLDKLIPELKKQSDEEKQALLNKVKEETKLDLKKYDDIEKALNDRIAEAKKDDKRKEEVKRLEALQAERKTVDERAKRLDDLETKFKEIRPEFVDPATKTKEKPEGELYKDTKEDIQRLNDSKGDKIEEINKKFRDALRPELLGDGTDKKPTLRDSFKLPTAEEIEAQKKAPGITPELPPPQPPQNDPTAARQPSATATRSLSLRQATQETDRDLSNEVNFTPVV